MFQVCVDKNFRGWRFEEKINHGLCATLFVVTSSATKDVMKKDSVREVKSTDNSLQTGKTYSLRISRVPMITRRFVVHKIN